MEKLAIIIPAHNEEKRILRTLEKYCSFFKKSQIFVIINNTRDNTKKIVQNLQKKYSNLHCHDYIQGGKGFAITQGFKIALKNKNFQYIGFVDADMATSPEAFYDLYKNINDFGGIIGSRYVPKAFVEPKQSWKRVFVSRVFNFLIRFLFLMNYRDTQCGAKIFKRDTIEKILPTLGITKWAYDVDLLYQIKRAGFYVREFPTRWSDEKYSKLNIKDASLNMILGILRLRILYSPFRDFIRLYNKFLGGRPL